MEDMVITGTKSKCQEENEEMTQRTEKCTMVNLDRCALFICEFQEFTNYELCIN